MNLEWTDERCRELDDLAVLIHVAGTLNCSSQIVEMIQRLEHLAAKLTRTDFATPRQSFTDFLRGLAIEARTNKQP
jgi:hypothetical protein